jgi:hypothetical protein
VGAARRSRRARRGERRRGRAAAAGRGRAEDDRSEVRRGRRPKIASLLYDAGYSGLTEAALATLPPEWREVVTTDLYFANVWHWPPSVVDEQPAARLDRLRIAHAAVTAGAEYRQNQNSEQQASLARARSGSHNSR